MQPQVPFTVLAACAQLAQLVSAAAQAEQRTTALYVASRLALRAALSLPAQGEPGASSSGSSSNGKLRVLLWGQLEQSGFLQQLPGLFSRTV